MLGLVWRELRHRRQRAIALGSGILVAAVSFSLLTAAASTSQAQIRGTIGRNFRGAYDILVRPPGSQTTLERTAGLVQTNYLSGIFGGITMAQWRQVERLPGVSVAAPIAMLGYVLPFENVRVPLPTPASFGHAKRQLFRVRTVVSADNGLSTYREPPSYVYLSSYRTTATGAEIAPDLPHGSGFVCRTKSPFDSPLDLPPATNAFQAASRTYIACDHAHATQAEVTVSFPFLLAAVDPVQERKLVDLPAAVTQGRYLSEGDRAYIGANGGGGPGRVVPVLAATTPFVDDRPTVQITRLRLSSRRIAGLLRGAGTFKRLTGVSGESESRRLSSDGLYQRLLSKPLGPNEIWTSSPITYRVRGPRSVTPEVVHNLASVWTSHYNVQSGFEVPPMDNDDVAFRRLQEKVGSNLISDGVVETPFLRVVGRIDAAKLPGFDPLTAVPLTTYNPPDVTAATPRTAQLLGHKPLGPDENIAGYLQPPPLLLTDLRSLPAILGSEHYAGTSLRAPISVIRVRVGGLNGPVRTQLTRIGEVALAIHRATGLEVDVTAGSSPTSVTVDLPAGRDGRPALALSEPWVEKGVAVVVLNAIDRKSVALFVLVLIVCGFFLTNASYASVRTRRRQIGTLRCLGWSRWEIFRVVLGEVALVGVIAGLGGAVLAALIAAGTGLHLPIWHALLVPPAALLLALGAGIGPAWRAARATPMTALHPAAASVRRSRPVRRVTGLAIVGLRQTKGRALLAAAGLAVGIAALDILLAISLGFRGNVSGSLLGSAVALQVRTVDYVSAALAIGLGIAGVIDVLLLNQAERARELATLRGTGWDDRELATLSVVEGLLITLVGSIVGVAVGVAGTVAITHTHHAHLGTVITAALIAVAGALAVVMLALLIPARAAQRISPARVLAEEV